MTTGLITLVQLLSNDILLNQPTSHLSSNNINQERTINEALLDTNNILIGRIGSKEDALSHLRLINLNQKIPSESRLNHLISKNDINDTHSYLYHYQLSHMIESSPSGLYFMDKTGCIACKIISPLNSFNLCNIVLLDWNMVLAKNSRTNLFWYLEIQTITLLDHKSLPSITSYHDIQYESLIQSCSSIPYINVQEANLTLLGEVSHLSADSKSVIGTIEAKSVISISDKKSCFIIEIKCGNQHGKLDTLSTFFIHYRDTNSAQFYEKIYSHYQILHVGYTYLFRNIETIKIKVQHSGNGAQDQFKRGFLFVFGKSSLERVGTVEPVFDQLIENHDCIPFITSTNLIS